MTNVLSFAAGFLFTPLWLYLVIAFGLWATKAHLNNQIFALGFIAFLFVMISGSIIIASMSK